MRLPVRQDEVVDYIDSPQHSRLELAAARIKGRRGHVVPLAPLALGIVRAALERRRVDGDGVAVFASKFYSRDALARHSLSQAIRRLISDPRLDGHDNVLQGLRENPPTPHDFRRTCATGMSQLGIAREDRKAVLGHAENDVHGVHYDKYEGSRRSAPRSLRGKRVTEALASADATWKVKTESDPP